ncbi:hypothetical protein [Bradyrhizobium sp. AZCC 2230]|uniref:hypothetical protein n=1 Tax=Bradyrhizobium sp. AZCC 2230 TaxID=3117021 RepID=UPI002FF1FB86
MKIPLLNEVNPHRAELEAKRISLHAQKTAKVAEAAAVRVRLQEAPSAGNAAENKVRAILGETLLPDTAPDMQRLETLLVELNTLNTALGKLDGQIATEKSVASRLVCEQVRPELTRLGKKFAQAFVDLHTAQHEYHSFLEKIQDTGAGIGSLPYVFISGLGSARDCSGTFVYGIKDFIEAGYLAQSDMPKVLTQ